MDTTGESVFEPLSAALSEVESLEAVTVLVTLLRESFAEVAVAGGSCVAVEEIVATRGEGVYGTLAAHATLVQSGDTQDDPGAGVDEPMGADATPSL